MDPQDELSPPEARKLIRSILEDGEVIYTRHAREEMANDDLHEDDCLNVLRGGLADPPEFHGSSNSLRYRVHTRKICFVVVFASEEKLFVITAWRKKGR